jgi:hypothetical protein
MDVRVNVSTRGRAQADAQSRSDGRGSAVIGNEPRWKPGFFIASISVVNVPEQRLWAVKREDGRAVFARLSEWKLPQSKRSRVRVRLMLAAEFRLGPP